MEQSTRMWHEARDISADIQAIRTTRPERAKVATSVQQSAERAARTKRIFASRVRNRTFNVVFALGVIALMTVFFGLLMINQAKLVEINYANAQAEAELRRLAVANSQARELIIRDTDLTAIELEAREMGLVPLKPEQVIPAKRPLRDEVIVGRSSLNARLVTPEEDALYLDRSGRDVEQWYADMLEDRPTDE